MVENRASKKQRELLEFIDGFINENGYGPSYREIMRGLGYKSVSTVAVHVNGLITRGFLKKGDYSARSLEVVTTEIESTGKNLDQATHIKWLQQELEKRQKDSSLAKEAQILKAALDILEQTKTIK